MNLGEVTAVVLNWRTPELTIRSVMALIDDGLPASRIVVVDNGSEDGSVERFHDELAECHVLTLGENQGFARANNRGAAELPGGVFLFVNSDAFVHRPGSVAALARLVGPDGAADLAVPRLLNDDLTLQPSVVPFSTPLPELVRTSGLSRFVPNRLQPALGTHWDHSYSRPIQSAVGAVVAVSAPAWRRLGGFAEQRFMYAEDHDLFWRAHEAGMLAMFDAEAEFIHLGGGSSEQRWQDPKRARRVAAMEAEMIREHLGPARARLTVGLMAAGVGARAAIERIRGRPDAAAIHSAWMRGYLSSPDE